MPGKVRNTLSEKGIDCQTKRQNLKGPSHLVAKQKKHLPKVLKFLFLISDTRVPQIPRKYCINFGIYNKPLSILYKTIHFIWAPYDMME